MNDMQTVIVPMESLAEVIVLQLKNGGRANLTVTGSSMMPFLYHRRDSVLLRPVTQQQKRGDLILYRRENGQYILHRIIKVTQGGYICCGDNQYEPEDVAHDQLIAVVESITRKGKTYMVDAVGPRLYTAAWVGFFPLRRYYIALRRRLARLRRGMKAARKRLYK